MTMEVKMMMMAMVMHGCEEEDDDDADDADGDDGDDAK